MRTPTAALLILITSLAACATGGAPPEAKATMASAPTQPCNSDSVTLAIATGTLHGTLLCPTAPPPWPVALLIAGSGPTDRNGNSAGLPGPNNSLQMLATALASRGIASLRYDKRGIGASRAAMTSEADLRFDMLADDAAEWVRLLRNDPRFRTVTVIGHSEGSLLGMLAAQRAGADAYVSIAGVGRPASQVLHEQLAARAPASLVAESDSIMARLSRGEMVDSVPPALAALFRPSVQPYLISWFRYDPAAELRKLKIPVLIAQGTTDIQVSEQDARLLAAADRNAQLVMVDGMNHVLKLVPADYVAQMNSYSDPKLPVAPDLVDAIVEFVSGVHRR
jgi:pimeloyl-ACP methyl ester carboxylesterase